MAKKNVTSDKILNAAQEEFLEKGFSGTSINDIGKKAGIHKSLIYHHFKNKEDLWKAVKSKLLTTHNEQTRLDDEFFRGTFEEFLTEYVKYRFDFYDKNHAIARLIAWQRLENERENLEGLHDSNWNSLVPQIIEFQRHGRIRGDLDPEMIEYIIMNVTTLPFLAKSTIFEGKQGKLNKQKYMNLVIESLRQTFDLK